MGNPICRTPFITYGSAEGEGLTGNCLDSRHEQQVENSFTRGGRKADTKVG